jgi:hypothetical protein
MAMLNKQMVYGFMVINGYQLVRWLDIKIIKQQTQNLGH